MDARKILGLYLMILVGLVLYYQQSDNVLLQSNAGLASLRDPAGFRSVLNSQITSICSDWTPQGPGKFRRCERSFEASNWAHFEVGDSASENFPQAGLKLGSGKIALVEYWLAQNDLTKLKLMPISSISLQFAGPQNPACAFSEIPDSAIQFVTLKNSLGALKWSDLNRPGSRFSIPFKHSGWKFESLALQALERQALEQLLEQQEGRLLLYVSPQLPEACVAEFKRATLNIRYLEVM